MHGDIYVLDLIYLGLSDAYLEGRTSVINVLAQQLIEIINIYPPFLPLYSPNKELLVLMFLFA
jgi:hypothetical protein